MINTVASGLDLFLLSSYIVQLCQYWTSASLINNQKSLSSNTPSRLRVSDVISYFCVLQSPLPALISQLAGNKVTHCSLYSHSDRKSMSSSISKWAQGGERVERAMRGGDVGGWGEAWAACVESAVWESARESRGILQQ